MGFKKLITLLIFYTWLKRLMLSFENIHQKYGLYSLPDGSKIRTGEAWITLR